MESQPRQAPTDVEITWSESEAPSDRSDEEDATSDLSDDEEEARIQGAFKKPATWMIFFACILAISGGITNVLTFLLMKSFSSHVTGTVSKIGVSIAAHAHGTADSWDVTHVVIVVGCFMGGAFLCGLLIDSTHVHIGSKSFYGVALLGNSALTIVARFCMPNFYAVYIVAVAMGLQNAMCTSHLGAVLRTTHVTGLVTDMGSATGRMTMLLLRNGCSCSRFSRIDKAKYDVDAKKLSVLVSVFVSFLLGTILGAFLAEHIKENAFFVPAGITGLAGILYTLLRSKIKECIKMHHQEGGIRKNIYASFSSRGVRCKPHPRG